MLLLQRRGEIEWTTKVYMKMPMSKPKNKKKIIPRVKDSLEPVEQKSISMLFKTEQNSYFIETTHQYIPITGGINTHQRLLTR